MVAVAMESRCKKRDKKRKYKKNIGGTGNEVV